MQRFVCRAYKVCLQRYNLCHAEVVQTNFVSSLYSTQYTVYRIQYTDNVCGRYEKVSDFMTNFVICMTN